jgi:acid phosphatase
MRGVGYSVEEAPFERFLVFAGGASHTDETVRLAALGDMGTGEPPQTMLGNALYHIDQKVSLDGIILLGDNIYKWKGKGDIAKIYRDCFELPYAPLLGNGVQFYAALGNHDYLYGQMHYQIHYPLFNMNGRRYYSKIFGENMVEVFFVDSNTIKEDPQQVEWLEHALNESTACWKIIAMHHPLYSSARTYPSDSSMIQLLEPIFLNNGVDIVLYGHNHVYERLRPIHGIQYITAGSGGQLRKGNLVPASPLRIAGNDIENVGLILEFRRDLCQLTAFGLNEKLIDVAEIPHASIGGAKKSTVFEIPNVTISQS